MTSYAVERDKVAANLTSRIIIAALPAQLSQINHISEVITAKRVMNDFGVSNNKNLLEFISKKVIYMLISQPA